MGAMNAASFAEDDEAKQTAKDNEIKVLLAKVAQPWRRFKMCLFYFLVD